MSKDLICFFAWLFLSAIVIFANPSRGQEIEDLQQHVLEIYSQDKKLIGTGTVVSFRGLILTAKHVLYDIDGAANAPNYFATVLIRFKDERDFDRADLVAVHPFLDIAILQLRGGSRQPIPAKIETDANKLTVGQQVVMMGHVTDTGELNQEKTGQIDQIDRHGHLVVSRMVRSGSSGGPVFIDNRLIGVLRNSAADHATVVPIARAIEYFRFVGIFFGDKGVDLRTGDIAGLASKVERYEIMLAQIERDLSWTARLSEIKPPTPGTSNLKLVISFERKLQIQPNLEGTIEISAVPIFRADAFDKLKFTERWGFSRSARIKNGSVEFNDIKEGLDDTIQDYANEKSITFTVETFTGLDLKVLVHSIRDTGYILPPRTLSTCFSIRTDNNGIKFLKPLSSIGTTCNEALSYVDSVRR